MFCRHFTVTTHGQDLVSGTSLNKLTNHGAQSVGRDFCNGFGRLDTFLYLKTEAELAPER